MNIFSSAKRICHKTLALAAFTSTLLGIDVCYAQERQLKIEAAFLYNFIHYITWPGYQQPDELTHVTICLYRNDPLIPYMEYIEHKKTQNHALSVKLLERESDIANCQILFSDQLSQSELTALASHALQQKVVLVSNTPDFIDNGGMIGLTQEDERIAIDINYSLLKQGGFQVSSRLLNLARKVH